MIKTVIIGFAHMHVNEIALYIKEQPETELLGISDIPAKEPENTEKRYTRAWNLKNVAKLSNAPIYDDYKEMLDEIRPDYAYILCENYKKPEIAAECAKRKVNVVLEKPMAQDLDGAMKIAQLKEKYNVEIVVNWPVAWRHYLHEFKDAADRNICGKPIRLRYINGHTGPLGKGAKHRGVSDAAEEMTDEERSRIWWYKSECGGGGFLDILCYGCYFTRWLLGLPVSVSAMGANLGTPYANCEDNTVAFFRFKDNLMASAEGSWTIPRVIVPAGPQLLCESGAIVCEGGADSGQHTEAYDFSGNKSELPKTVQSDSYKNMPWHIAAHLKGEKLFEPITLEFNLDVMRMLNAAIRSDKSHAEELI